MDQTLLETPSGFAALVGFRMVEWEQGHARFELPLRAELLNRVGIPHGGMHATLLDTVMGYAGCWTGDAARRQTCMTLSLNVQYLSRPKGDLLIAKGRKTGGGRSTFFAEGEIVDDTGELIAKASGVFRYNKGA